MRIHADPDPETWGFSFISLPVSNCKSSHIAGGEISAENTTAGPRGQRDLSLLRTERSQLLHGDCGGARL